MRALKNQGRLPIKTSILGRTVRVIVSQAAWREIGGKRKYFRSAAEANYGRYLQWLKESGKILEWEHEPKTFWFDGIKRGTVSYKPDFCVTYKNGQTEWFEVKGFMDKKSVTKLARFKKYFPNEKLTVIGPEWFKKTKLKLLIKDWEK